MLQIFSKQELKDKLTKLFTQGFTQIKLPGGTSKNKEHYSGVVLFYYEKETKITYFSGVPYNPEFFKKGENDITKVDGETPKGTARREVQEEVGLILDLKNLEEIPDTRKVCPGKVPGTKHTKYFFLAKNPSGHTLVFDGPNAIDGETAAPLWFPASYFKEVLWPGHQVQFKGACQLLSMDKEICMSIMDILM